MKKQLIAILCVLVLLLTACEGVPTAPTTTAAAETAAPTTEAAPTTAEPTAPTTEPPAPTTEPPAPETYWDESSESMQLVYPTAEETPDDLDWDESAESMQYPEPETEPTEPTEPEEPRNWTVHTDWSAYQPYQAPKAVYTRLHDGPLDHFVPSADYGAVYPYAAAKLFSVDFFVDTAQAGATYEEGNTYGLVDGTGRILTDGIFLNIFGMSAYDYAAESYRDLPIWVVTQYKMAKSSYWDGDDREVEYEYAKRVYGLIAKDGSFALDCEYNSINALGNGFYCLRNDKKPFLSIYDLKGNLLLTEEDFFGSELPKGWEYYDLGVYFQYSEGWYLASVINENGYYEYSFYDGAGKVLGPYADARVFQDGLACVSLDGDHYGYIDKSGAWVLKPVYRYGNSFFRNRAVQKGDDYVDMVIDRTGAEIFRAEEGGDIGSSECGYCVWYYDEGRKVYCDLDGNELFTSDGWCLDENTFYEYAGGDTRVVRVGPEGQRELIIPYVSSLTYGVAMVDGELRRGYLNPYQYDSEKLIFVDQDLTSWKELKASRLPADDVYSYFHETRDELTGERWEFFWTGTAWEGLSENDKRVTLPLRSGFPKPRGGLFYCQTSDAACYLDETGKTVFRWPLDAED